MKVVKLMLDVVSLIFAMVIFVLFALLLIYCTPQQFSAEHDLSATRMDR